MPIPHSILYALALAAAGAALILAGFWLGKPSSPLAPPAQPPPAPPRWIWSSSSPSMTRIYMTERWPSATRSGPRAPTTRRRFSTAACLLYRWSAMMKRWPPLPPFPYAIPMTCVRCISLPSACSAPSLSHGALAYMDYVAGQAPDDVGFALSRADVLSDLGRQQDALSLFSSVSVPNEKDAQIAAAWGMATCYARQEQYDQAAAQYRSALALGCDDPECRLLLSQILKQGGKDDEALEATLKQILLTPDFGPCYAQAARLLLDAGDPAQALSYLEQAAARMDDPLHYEKARCLAALGRKGEALAALERLIGQQSDGLREYLRQQAKRISPHCGGIHNLTG